MSDYFFDTSALIKRYIAEVGSTWVRATTDPATHNSIFVAHIVGIELVSGMTRRVREGTLSIAAARQARLTANAEISHNFHTIAFGVRLDASAQDLLERHPLRAYDAVQLASALADHRRLQASGQAGLIFVAADQRLLAAATAEGLTTDNPTLHP